MQFIDEVGRYKPPKEGEWNLSELNNMREDINNIKIEHSILKESYNLTNTFIERSINALTKNVETLTEMVTEIKEQNANTKQELALERQRFEYEIAKVKEENDRQDEKIKTLSLKDHAVLWWQNPINKLLSGIVAIILFYIATQLGVPVQEILK